MRKRKSREKLKEIKRKDLNLIKKITNKFTITVKKLILDGLHLHGKRKSKVLDQFNLEYNKIASAMIVDLDFLEAVAKEKKHTFISTGMSNIQDIDEAVNIFKKINAHSINALYISLSF